MKEQSKSSLLIEEFDEKSKLKSFSNGYNYLIFVLAGKGSLHYVSKKHKYEENDLFIFSSEDSFLFDVKKNCHLVSIQFDDSYFQNQNAFQDHFRLQYDPNHLVKIEQLKVQKMNFQNKANTLIRNTIKNLLILRKDDNFQISPIVYFQLLSLFGIIEKTQKIAPKENEKDNLINDLIAFIKQNIYSPQKVQIKSIAANFNISINYFSAYFKKNFGKTYKNYIDDYKLEIIESRIKSGLYTMKQIAEELNFIDDSHLTHFFKNKKGITPTEFKTNCRNNC